MKKILLMFIWIIASVTMLPAQQNAAPAKGEGKHPSFEQFMQYKASFIVREMKLSAADSARFVPMYAELQRSKADLYKKYEKDRAIRHKFRKGEPLTDAEYVDLATHAVELQAAEAQCDVQYLEKFKTVLSARQLFDYVHAEKKFKSEMMKRGGNHRGQKKTAAESK